MTQIRIPAPTQAATQAQASARQQLLADLLEELTGDEPEGFLRGTRALRLARERLHATLSHPAPETAR